MLPTPHSRSRNFMQRSYIVWSRDLTLVTDTGSKGAYAPPIFTISDTDF
jgi:hypothetical protein